MTDMRDKVIPLDGLSKDQYKTDGNFDRKSDEWEGYRNFYSNYMWYIYFDENDGNKVKIKKINFNGVNNVKESKLVRAMKKTRDNRLQNLFSSKKFQEKEYDNDKRAMLSVFNEAGYRDARIVKEAYEFMDKSSVKGGYGVEVFRRTVN